MWSMSWLQTLHWYLATVIMMFLVSAYGKNPRLRCIFCCTKNLKHGIRMLLMDSNDLVLVALEWWYHLLMCLQVISLPPQPVSMCDLSFSCWTIACGKTGLWLFLPYSPAYKTPSIITRDVLLLGAPYLPALVTSCFGGFLPSALRAACIIFKIFLSSCWWNLILLWTSAFCKTMSQYFGWVTLLVLTEVNGSPLLLPSSSPINIYGVSSASYCLCWLRVTVLMALRDLFSVLEPRICLSLPSLLPFPFLVRCGFILILIECAPARFRFVWKGTLPSLYWSSILR